MSMDQLDHNLQALQARLNAARYDRTKAKINLAFWQVIQVEAERTIEYLEEQIEEYEKAHLG